MESEMIMTREEYEELKDSGDPAGETIEALRNVARAAENSLNYDMRRAIWTLDDDEAQDMQDALDALPRWITEDGE